MLLPAQGRRSKHPLVIRSLVDDGKNEVMGHGIDRRADVLAALHSFVGHAGSTPPSGFHATQEAIITRAAITLALRDLKRKRPRVPALVPDIANAFFADHRAMAEALNRASRKLSGATTGRRNAASAETSGVRFPVARKDLRRKVDQLMREPRISPIEVGWIIRYYGLAVTRHTGTERIYDLDLNRLQRIYEARVATGGRDFVGLEDARRHLMKLARAGARNIFVDLEDDDSRRILARG